MCHLAMKRSDMLHQPPPHTLTNKQITKAKKSKGQQCHYATKL